MRPRRLELSGFTSFKEPTEIDFEGSDFFALVGATGAGKSSVIDAMCFALYGSVPRYENRNLVAPVISHGRVEAKVLLEFSIDGKDYTAVRVVRRSGKGATTKEARLEAGGEVLAGNADELTERVTELIGLSFEHFTKCVVLPQGDFARFLHDKPSERQDLVVKLLNLGVYEKMRHLATARATEKKYERERAERRLSDDLALATPEALAEAKARAKRLADLRKRVTQAKPALDEAQRNARDSLAKATEALGMLKLVNALEMPRGIDELGERIEEAGKKLAALEKAAGAARKKVETATTARKKLPERTPLSVALAAHDRRSKLAASAEPTRKALARAAKEHEAASKELQQAETAVPAAEQAKADIERKHAALHVATTLEKGEPCPVCLQPVGKLPKHPAVPGLDAAEKTVAEARSLLAEARKLDGDAAKALTKAQSEADLLESQIAELDAELADHPDRARLEKQLVAVDEAEAALDRARAAEDELRAEADDARKQLDALQRKETEERRRFETARDKVSALRPPPAARDSLATDWAALVEWATERGKELAAEAEALANTAQDAEREREKLLDELLAACTDCELDVKRDEDPLEAVVEAQAEAKAQVADVQAAIETAKTLRRELKRLEIDHKTAEDLALHLSARAGRFENWLVNAALRRLVDGATHILNQLSNGQYALTIDEQGSFQVIDRHNADETRSAKTLSGGETFLASLSLALALADQLADLASDGAASLEAIFLDEGFGTLDADTLDTVAATVENLAESGRMVGIVTHVRELAERVPVQFRVKKDLRTSTVERVIA
ncbi:MAG TPA: SMC family ATPase [Actinomycetota bacterium]|nr:SMC family ATPase [Actinomycetota bacterium]